MKILYKIFGLYCLFFGLSIGFAQENKLKLKRVDTIEIKTALQQHITYLASDSLQGRALGSKGYELSAAYAIKEFKSYGVVPFFTTYEDPFIAKGIDTKNIVAFIKGNDSLLSREYIVLGAHLDHIGIQKQAVKTMDSIANGANDNATGVSVVLSLAKHFAKIKSTKRSLIFILFGAEESGLIGSAHIANRFKELEVPIYTMLNFEMVGVPMVDKSYNAYLTGFAKSNMADKLNSYAHKDWIGFLPKAEEYQLFKRSDNYSFYKELKIPSHTLSAFDFSNYDYYHHVDDETSHMNIDFMTALVESIIVCVEKMANTADKEIRLN
ncbi:M28 family metallopeptidase [Aquimarina sp. W85]|uniref:M28 family metallopeptidase n=1 Tax=Aquimarina rhodophyticola TaxID=3342246 RepID=UPI00366AC2B1